MRPILKQLDEISAEMDAFSDVDEELKDIRAKISKLDEEFAVETAKRKREARKIIESEDGEVTYEENVVISAKLDSLVESGTESATEEAETEPEEIASPF